MGGEAPGYRVSGGDLVLAEALPPSTPASSPLWLQSSVGESCTSVCASVGGTCDETTLWGETASSPDLLLPAVEESFLCTPPLIAGCEGTPRMSGIGDGYRRLRPCPVTTPPSVPRPLPRDPQPKLGCP